LLFEVLNAPVAADQFAFGQNSALLQLDELAPRFAALFVEPLQPLAKLADILIKRAGRGFRIAVVAHGLQLLVDSPLLKDSMGALYSGAR
jgi:hypothetical protein